MLKEASNRGVYLSKNGLQTAIKLAHFILDRRCQFALEDLKITPSLTSLRGASSLLMAHLDSISSRTDSFLQSYPGLISRDPMDIIKVSVFTACNLLVRFEMFKKVNSPMMIVVR